MRKLIAAAILCLVATAASGQGLPVKDGVGGTLATVTASKALLVADAPSTRPTYMVSMGAQATTAAMTLSIESAAGTGFRLAFFCVSTSDATAAAKVDVVIQRRTTASSGGVACTNEFTTVGGTGCAISKNDPADGSYGGIGRNGGTPGTAGAVLGQYGFVIGELGAGTADTDGPLPFCVDFGTRGGKMPTSAAGASNGITITVSAAGAGGLAAGAITANIIAE